MNNYIVRQQDIEILMQSDKTLFYKLELLNKDMRTIDLVEGNLISDNISINSEYRYKVEPSYQTKFLSFYLN